MTISPRAAILRLLTALHTALGRWLAQADQPAAPKPKACSWFDLSPGALEAPGNPDEEAAERRRRNTFWIGHS